MLSNNTYTHFSLERLYYINQEKRNQFNDYIKKHIDTVKNTKKRLNLKEIKTRHCVVAVIRDFILKWFRNKALEYVIKIFLNL
jgi:predicted metal-dependent hydrolase